MTKTYSSQNNNNKIQNINIGVMNRPICPRPDISFLKDICSVSILDLKRGKRYFFLYSSSYLHSTSYLSEIYFSGRFFESMFNTTLKYTHKNDEPDSANGLICTPFNFVESNAYSMQKVIEHFTSIPTDVINIVCEFLG